tara:strand:- start:9 stop:212 length:204 start_codon:yes stop_codon:yes gene_type:complete
MNIRRSKALKIPLEPTTPKKCEHKPEEVHENPDASLSQRSKCSHHFNPDNLVGEILESKLHNRVVTD